MKSFVTESECRMRGCCWNIANKEDGTPVEGLPWCFFPGGNPQCALAQAEKDADIVVKTAAEAYHNTGDFETANTYRKACLSRSDHFYSFYLTPEYWRDDGSESNWTSTQVTLVKYGCVAAACSTESEIKRMMAEIGAEQNRDIYPQGEHASLKFAVTGYSYITKGDTPVDPDAPPAPTPTVDEIYGISAAAAIALVVLSLMLICTTGVAFHFYRQIEGGDGLGMLDRIYVRKDSFPVGDDLGAPPSKPPHSALMPNLQVRDSLLNSAV